MIEFMLAMVLAGRDPAPAADCAQASTTIEINACAAADLEAETARMLRYLDAARTRAQAADAETSATGVPARQVTYLEESQAAWQAYADLVCEGVYDQWRDGTIRTAMSIGCRSELTRERAHVLWRNHLADMDPPVLPEPAAPVAGEP